MTKVINLFGSPGAGKSRMRADVFSLMKRLGLKCEEAPEFAKDVTYRGDLATLKHSQPLIFGEQHHRIVRCINVVDYVVCDSPLLLSLIYGTHLPASFSQSCLDIFHTFDNINFFIKLDPDKYQTYGRNQSKDESLKIEENILDLLAKQRVPYKFAIHAEDIVKAIHEQNQK